MANHYTELSVMYPLKPEQRKLATEIIEDVGIETAANYAGYAKGSEDYNELEPDIQFDFEFHDEGVWIHHDESANPEQVACVISHFQKEFCADKPFCFSYARNCSKPVIDEFGGGSFAIMPDGDIFHSGTGEDALNKAEQDATYARVVWTAEDVQTLKPSWTLEECEDFLSENENGIRDRLIELGWEVIQALLPVKKEA